MDYNIQGVEVYKLYSISEMLAGTSFLSRLRAPTLA